MVKTCKVKVWGPNKGLCEGPDPFPYLLALPGAENGTVSTPVIPTDLEAWGGGRIRRDGWVVAVWKAPWRRQQYGEGRKRFQ